MFYLIVIEMLLPVKTRPTQSEVAVDAIVSQAQQTNIDHISAEVNRKFHTLF